jgi:Flp pilus assembly protein TadD
MDVSLEQCMKAQRLAPGNAEFLTGVGTAELPLGRWEAALEHAKQAERLDPRSIAVLRRLGMIYMWTRRYREAREVVDRGLALAPSSPQMIEYKAMTFLGEGDLARARAALKAAPGVIEPSALVAYVALYWDLAWVLDDGQRGTSSCV